MRASARSIVLERLPAEARRATGPRLGHDRAGRRSSPAPAARPAHEPTHAAGVSPGHHVGVGRRCDRRQPRPPEGLVAGQPGEVALAGTTPASRYAATSAPSSSIGPASNPAGVVGVRHAERRHGLRAAARADRLDTSTTSVDARRRGSPRPPGPVASDPASASTAAKVRSSVVEASAPASRPARENSCPAAVGSRRAARATVDPGKGAVVVGGPARRAPASTRRTPRSRARRDRARDRRPVHSVVSSTARKPTYSEHGYGEQEEHLAQDRSRRAATVGRSRSAIERTGLDAGDHRRREEVVERPAVGDPGPQVGARHLQPGRLDAHPRPARRRRGPPRRPDG